MAPKNQIGNVVRAASTPRSARFSWDAEESDDDDEQRPFSNKGLSTKAAASEMEDIAKVILYASFLILQILWRSF